MSTSNVEHTLPELTPDQTNGPDWLRTQRNDSRENYNTTPLPQRGLHLWRYTDPAKFLVDSAAQGPSIFDPDYQTVERLEKRHVDEGHLACFVTDLGGQKILTHCGPAIAKHKIVVTSLSEAVKKYTSLVEPHLYRLINSRTGKFEAMNGALWQDGIFIYVPKGATVEQPIHLLREAGGKGSAQFPRLLVIVEQNADVTIVDEYGGGAHERETIAYSNGVVEIFGGQDSRIKYVCLQRQANGTNNYLTHRAQIEQGAQMLTIPLAFGAAISKQNFGVVMNGAGAHSNMVGLLFGVEHQHFDNHTLHHHAHSDTTSNIDFKVVLKDKAMSAYTGLIRIDHNAKNCQAYQENRNLLLTPGTKAETIPELEILNEDVSCTHGATVGPIDPMSIFYLRSRGISETDAVRMVVGGFVETTLKQLPEDIKERIRASVLERLEAI